MLERNLVYVGKAFFPLKQKGGPLLKGQLCRALGSLILCKYPCKKGTMVIVPLIPLSKPTPSAGSGENSPLYKALGHGGSSERPLSSSAG